MQPKLLAERGVSARLQPAETERSKLFPNSHTGVGRKLRFKRLLGDESPGVHEHMYKYLNTSKVKPPAVQEPLVHDVNRREETCDAQTQTQGNVHNLQDPDRKVRTEPQIFIVRLTVYTQKKNLPEFWEKEVRRRAGRSSLLVQHN